MAKYTLLQLVKTILSDIDGDEVTTISQTVESQQVALIVQTCFNDIIDRAELKTTKQVFQLTSATLNQPTLMTLPSVTNTIINLDWINYDKHLSTAGSNTITLTASIAANVLTVLSTAGIIVVGGVLANNVQSGTTIVNQLTGTSGGAGTYTVTNNQSVGITDMTLTVTSPDWNPVYYLPTEEFFLLTQSYSPSTGDVLVYSYTNPNGQVFNVNVKADIAPTWYTTLDDNTFLFDSFDNSVDLTGLTGIKTLAYGQQGTVFSQSDGFVPPLEDHQFSLLLQAATARAWVQLKQQANPKAEQSERRQWVHLQKTRRNIPTRVPAVASLPDYGRRGGSRQDWGADNMIDWMRKGK